MASTLRSGSFRARHAWLPEASPVARSRTASASTSSVHPAPTAAVRPWRAIAFVAPLVAALVACGGTTNPSETSSGASTNGTSSSASQASKCDELANAARTALDQSAKRACTKNGDCVGVAFSAKCFDGCTTAIASDQKPAFEQARAKVDGAQCADFEKLGCKVVIPPCVPPAEPACVDGACQ